MAILNRTEGICQRYARLYACAKRNGKIGGENGGAMLIGFGYILMAYEWCRAYNGDYIHPNGYVQHQQLMQYLNALQNACDGDRRVAELGY